MLLIRTVTYLNYVCILSLSEILLAGSWLQFCKLLVFDQFAHEYTSHHNDAS